MYLFAARLRARRGMGAEAADYMTRSRELLSSLSDTPFWAWSVASGDDVGTFMLSARVDSIEHYMMVWAAITRAAGFHEMTKSSIELFDGPSDTAFSEVMAVAGNVGDSPAPLVMVTTATIAPGQQAAAIPWGVNVLNHVVTKAGGSGMFTTSPMGAISDVSWIQGFGNPGDLDNLNTMLKDDPQYLEMLGQSGDLFVAGSGHRMVLVQMP
jgi:hypothetical protein